MSLSFTRALQFSYTNLLLKYRIIRHDQENSITSFKKFISFMIIFNNHMKSISVSYSRGKIDLLFTNLLLSLFKNNYWRRDTVSLTIICSILQYLSMLIFTLVLQLQSKNLTIFSMALSTILPCFLNNDSVKRGT